MDNGNSNLITKNDARIASLFTSIDRTLEKMERITQTYKPPLNGERFITDRELQGILKIGRRALHDWRLHGKIPYYQIGAKILYRESDIEKMLEANYRKAYSY